MVIVMVLQFNAALIENYHSSTQIARILTENWVNENMYCPRCGRPHLQQFKNNRPVADFFCPDCGSEYELKSKNGKLGHSISDGAYETMIQRINSNNNPDFFFMSYSKKELCVTDLFVIPKHFFWAGIIEKRKPLAPTARRAGWIGCNILIDQIPAQGRIPIVIDGLSYDKNVVVNQLRISNSLETNNVRERGWLFDVLNCINSIPKSIFSLQDVYGFEKVLASKHPGNNNVLPKIRQQLQVLRDMNILVFLGKGQYRKVYFSEE